LSKNSQIPYVVPSHDSWYQHAIEKIIWGSCYYIRLKVSINNCYIERDNAVGKPLCVHRETLGIERFITEQSDGESLGHRCGLRSN